MIYMKRWPNLTLLKSSPPPAYETWLLENTNGYGSNAFVERESLRRLRNVEIYTYRVYILYNNVNTCACVKKNE